MQEHVDEKNVYINNFSECPSCFYEVFHNIELSFLSSRVRAYHTCALCQYSGKGKLNKEKKLV